MLAKEMLIQQRWLHYLDPWIKLQCLTRQSSDEFQHTRVVNGFADIPAPGERAMTGNHHGGMMQGIELFKGFDDDVARIGFVAGLDFPGRQSPGARDGAMPIIGLGGAKRGDVPAGLRPGGRIKAVGMGDAADTGKCTVEHQMGRRIGTGPEMAFHHFAISQ